MTAYYQAGALNYSRYGLSWHTEEFRQQARSVHDDDTVTEAMKLAGIYDIEVGRAQARVVIEGKTFPLPKETLYMTGCEWATETDGTIVFDRNVRDYVPVQNRQLAEILDPLSQELIMAGVMQVGKQGQIVAIQMEMEPFVILGKEEERHQTFLLITEDRLTGFKFYGLTMTRVVCQNTYNMAIRDIPSLPSLGRPELVYTFRTRLFEQAVKEQKSRIEMLEQLARTECGEYMVMSVAEKLYSMPKRGGTLALYDTLLDMGADADTDDPTNAYILARGKKAEQHYDNTIDRTLAHRGGILQAYRQFNDEHPYAANTLYGLWQAVTYNANHGDAYRNSDEEARQFNIMFNGTRLKVMENAWKLIVAKAKS